MMDVNNACQHFTKCSKCRQGVEYFCFSCNLGLCQGCREIHEEDNTAHDVRMYRERYKTLFPEQCDRHPEKQYTKYCKDCLVPLCVTCIGDHAHQAHELGDINVAYTENRETYGKWCNEMKRESKTRRTFIQSELDSREDMLTRLEKAKRFIDAMVVEIETSCKNQVRILKTTKKELRSKITQIKNMLKRFENSANHPVQFVMFMKDYPLKGSRRPDFCDLPLATSTGGVPDKDKIEKLIVRLETTCRPPQSVKTEKRTLLVPELTSIRHISCLAPNHVWFSDNTNLVCTDLETMKPLQKVCIPKDSYGCHTVNDKDDLIFIDSDHNIVKLSQDVQSVHVEVAEPWEPISLCFSSFTNARSLLVGMIIPLQRARVVRYNDEGKEVQSLECDSKDHALFEAPAYITENKNGDVIVSDYKKKAVIVVDSEGKHKFSYWGPPLGRMEELWPRGVCTDSQANILVANFSPMSGAGLHVLDEDGHVLKLVNLDPDLKKPFGLGYDLVKETFMVGSIDNNVLHVSHMSDYLA